MYPRLISNSLQLRMTLNFQNARIIGEHYHVRFMQHWGLNPGFCKLFQLNYILSPYSSCICNNSVCGVYLPYLLGALNWVWWLSPAILALGNWKQEHQDKYVKIILSYTAKSSPAWTAQDPVIAALEPSLGKKKCSLIYALAVFDVNSWQRIQKSTIYVIMCLGLYQQAGFWLCFFMTRNFFPYFLNQKFYIDFKNLLYIF